MRVLHVMAEMDPKKGGVGQAVRTIITGLNRINVENDVVSLDDPEALFLKEEVLHIYALGPAKGPWSYSSKLKPWLLKNLENYDSVIVHGLWLYHGYAVKRVLGGLKANVIGTPGVKNAVPRLFVMPHGMLDPYFQKASGRKLKAWRNILYWKFIEGGIINQASGLFFTSEAERVLAHQPFKPYKPRLEAVVGLGIDGPPVYNAEMKKACFDKCPEALNSPYILYLGRIDQKKGADLLIKAYTNLAAEIAANGDSKTSNYQLPKLVIAGPGAETAFGINLQQLAENFKERILFPGMLLGDAKWGAFYHCDAFVLPSHQENFGIAVVEALSCEKPVLLSDQVNIWQEIKEAGAGLVEPDTEEGTYKLLKGWYQLPKEDKLSMASNAVSCFKTYFSIGPVAERIKSEISKNQGLVN